MEKLTEFDKDMSAVTFAEAGEHESAQAMLDSIEEEMPRKHATLKKKPYLATIIFGAISISAYIALFSNERLITTNFTMGGWHTVLPVGTAFFFSFIHGAFASNLLSSLGVEARK